MQCNQCGSPVPEGQYICPACGAYVGSIPQNPTGGYSQPGYGNQNQGYNQPGYGNPNQGYNQLGYGDQNQGYSYLGYGAPNQGYNQLGYGDQNQGYSYPGYGAPNQGYSQPGYGNPVVTQKLGMKWFKFVIYFQLFASLFVGFVFGIEYITGNIYVTALMNSSEIELTESQIEQMDSMIRKFYDVFDGLKIVDVTYGIVLIVLAVFAIYVRHMLARFKRIGPNLYIGFVAAHLFTDLIYVICAYAIIKETSVLASAISSLFWYIILLVGNIEYFKKRRYLFAN